MGYLPASGFGVWANGIRVQLASYEQVVRQRLVGTTEGAVQAEEEGAVGRGLQHGRVLQGATKQRAQQDAC